MGRHLKSLLFPFTRALQNDLLGARDSQVFYLFENYFFFVPSSLSAHGLGQVLSLVQDHHRTFRTTVGVEGDGTGIHAVPSPLKGSFTSPH